MRDPPDCERLQALHARLLRGDRVASEELSRIMLPSLVAEVGRKFPRTDDQVVADGVIDAVLDYCARPQQFNETRRVPLDRFLAAAAWRNVDNLVRGERRRKHREREVGRTKREADVAFDPVARNIRQEELRQLAAQTGAMFDALDDPKDKQIMALRLQGIRATSDFARVLDITHLPLAQQRKQVKRNKDRITRFLRRKGLLP
jgi:RNA polymerase sigma-70 factor (ECF subfamily)